MIFVPLNGVNFPEMPYIIVGASAAPTWPAQSDNENNNGKRETYMGRILLVIVVLLLLGILGVIGYAYLGDMTPATQEQRLEVTLPGGSGDN